MEPVVAGAAHHPTDEQLASELGTAHPCYLRILALTDGFSRTWQSSKRSGRMLKIADRRKALLYLVPSRDALRVSLTLREAERARLLDDPQLAALHETMRAARRYAEGYALFFEVRDDAGCRPVTALIEKLLPLRS